MVPARVFIAYDFAIARNTPFANVMEAAVSTQPAELELRWPGDPSQQARPQGLIWSNVRVGIEEAERVMAFIDLPNANVAFEIGYAFGKEKKVAVYRFLARDHAWHRAPPLRGHFRDRLSLVAEIHQAALNGHYMQLGERGEAGDAVLLLCPERAGNAFLSVIPPEWGWVRPPHSQWDLEKLPHQLAGIGLVVWIVAPHSDGEEERDGAENAALAVLAGYAQARPELKLEVLIHRGARPVADVEDRAVPFTSNRELHEALQKIASMWKAGRAAPLSVAPAAVPARPAILEPLPVDNWGETRRRFIGRRRQLIDAAEAIRGLVERFTERRDAGGSQAVKFIWAYGFGGMGKSWYLHRVRGEAEAAQPALRSLIVDFDARPSNVWRYPLRDLPRRAEHVFDPIAFRLAQRLSVGEADPYWLARAQVAAGAAEHRRMRARFEDQIALAKTNGSDQVEPAVRHLLKQECSAPNLWELPPEARARLIASWADDPGAVRAALQAWCEQAGVDNPAVTAPDRVLAEGLRQALRAAMQRHPLLLLLDTAELLWPDLQTWLRELLVPLLREAQPLLVLVGSRLRPDSDQPPGSRVGWLSEVPAEAVRVEVFTDLLRLSVEDIEAALDRLTRAVPSSRGRTAEQLHRVALGVPLAVRTLLDLHEQGDDVLERLAAVQPAARALSDNVAMDKVVAATAERMLLHLAGHPAKEHDLRAIIALALLTAADDRLLRSLWGADVDGRLLDLGSRYSLLADGDLHPTVRAALRRYWRNPAVRPTFFGSVLSALEAAAAALPAPAPGAPPQERFVRLAHELNLMAWRDGEAVLPRLARAICVAAAFGCAVERFMELLAELPLPPRAPGDTEALWQQGPGPLADDRRRVEWMRAQQAAAPAAWTQEEAACLDLLDGIAGANTESAQGALAALSSLERGLAFFGVDQVPRREVVGQAFFMCGRTLRSSAGLAGQAIAAIERGLALGVDPHLGELSLMTIYLEEGNLDEAERRCLRALEVDPRDHFLLGAMGFIKMMRKRPEEGEQLYRRILEIEPLNAECHVILGLINEEHHRDLTAAQQHYRRAIELDPRQVVAWRRLGTISEVRGEPEEAERHYQQALRQGEDPASQTALGWLHLEGGRYERAVDTFRAVTGGQATVDRGLAWVALLDGDHTDEALRLASSAAALEPEHPGTTLLPLAVEIWLGHWDSVREAFSSWVKGIPDAPAAYPIAARSVLAALFRRLSTQGKLGEALPILRAASASCWVPWADAIGAVLAGSPREAIAEDQARYLAQLMLR